MVMFDVSHLVSIGLWLVALMIFAESGMLVGFFFPGDTLLLSVGIFAAAGKLPLASSILLIAAAAILGDNIGYQIGRSLGPRLFRKDSLVFRHEYIMKAEEFYEKYGSRTMLLAHFVPIVRTFAPVTAGAGQMNRAKFFIYDAIGDTAWAAGVTLFGYFVASKIPGVEKFVTPVLIGVVLITVIPTAIHAIRDPRIRSHVSRRIRRKPAAQLETKNSDDTPSDIS